MPCVSLQSDLLTSSSLMSWFWNHVKKFLNWTGGLACIFHYSHLSHGHQPQCVPPLFLLSTTFQLITKNDSDYVLIAIGSCLLFEKESPLSEPFGSCSSILSLVACDHQRGRHSPIIARNLNLSDCSSTAHVLALSPGVLISSFEYLISSIGFPSRLPRSLYLKTNESEVVICWFVLCF